MHSGCGRGVHARALAGRAARHLGSAAAVACALFASQPAHSDLESLLARQPPAAYAKPPRAFTPQDVEQGAELYRTRCAICHGADGSGKGPASRGMVPRPIPLDDPKMQQQASDGQLFWAIHEGSHGTPMPAWHDTMTDDEMWQVVAFIRTLADPGGEPGAAAGGAPAREGSGEQEGDGG